MKPKNRLPRFDKDSLKRPALTPLTAVASAPEAPSIRRVEKGMQRWNHLLDIPSSCSRYGRAERAGVFLPDRAGRPGDIAIGTPIVCPRKRARASVAKTAGASPGRSPAS